LPDYVRGSPVSLDAFRRYLKARFHYASWIEPGSKLVADRLEAKFHYAIRFEAGRSRPPTSFEGSKLVGGRLRTSFEPDSVMEFGREPASWC